MKFDLYTLLREFGLTDIKKLYRQTDKILLFITVMLSCFGALMVCTATYDGGNYFSRDTIVMLIAMAIGVAGSMFISIIDYDVIFKFWGVIAAGCMGLMLLLIPFGVAPDGRSDAISWLRVGSLFFQPSEILKIGFIISFSVHLNKFRKNLTSLKNVLFLCFHAAVPVGIVVLTGDMGSALIFLCMFIGMMYVAGVHWLYFPAGAIMVASAAPLVWFKVFSSIQRDRILALFNPEAYPDEIWQQSQAANAIKAGGLFGTGLFGGEYTHSGLVPECENDMIFSVVCEEFGLIGAFLLLFVYCALAYKIIRVGKQSGSFTSQMMCYGVAFMIIAQVIVNIGMCLSLLPVIGITLPFISAGGSSTVCLYLAIGLVMSAYRSSHGIVQDGYNYVKLTKYNR